MTAEVYRLSSRSVQQEVPGCSVRFSTTAYLDICGASQFCSSLNGCRAQPSAQAQLASEKDLPGGYNQHEYRKLQSLRKSTVLSVSLVCSLSIAKKGCSSGSKETHADVSGSSTDLPSTSGVSFLSYSIFFGVVTRDEQLKLIRHFHTTVDFKRIPGLRVSCTSAQPFG